MMFSVAIFVGGAQYWGCQVEAEDRNGAVREAMRVVEARGGHFIFGHGARAVSGPVTVEVCAVERSSPLVEQMRAALRAA